MSEIQQVKRGTLVRHVPMRLVDVSLSGCLVEAEQDLDVGTRGTLEVDLWGVPCRYPIRVSRVMERPDASHTRRVAGEFSWRDHLVAKAFAETATKPARRSAKVIEFKLPSHRG